MNKKIIKKIKIFYLKKNIKTEGKLMNDKKSPYLIYKYNKKIILKGKIKLYNPNFGDDKICKNCGHTYIKHFDSWNNNYNCGCKYCNCKEFVKKKE